MLPISTIIPTYSRADLTAQALDSVYRQTAIPREVLVLDDASGSKSFARLQNACKHIAAKFPGSPIRLLLQTLSRHLGMPGAVRNIAMRRSSSPWLAFLDSDDIWLPHKLENQWQHQQQCGALVLHCREIWLRSQSPRASNSSNAPTLPLQTFLKRLQEQPGGSKGVDEAFIRELLLPPVQGLPPRLVSQKKHKQQREGQPSQLWPDALKKCIIGPSTLLMHQSVCQTAGYFDPKLQIAEDYEYFLRIIARFPVAYCLSALVAKRECIPTGIRGAAQDSLFPQLSRRYAWIEPLRIAALERLLQSKRCARLLSEAQRREAIAELQRKIGLCICGARKRRPGSERQIQELAKLKQKQHYWQNQADNRNIL